MPTKTGKPYSGYYKNDLAIDQSSNTGVDTTLRRVQDGAGNNTAIVLSDDNFLVKPDSDDTTAVLSVQNTSGNVLLAVDATNSKVNVGVTQVPATTQYAYFGIHGSDGGWSGAVADTHYAVPFNTTSTVTSLVSMGTSTDSSFNDTNPTNLTLASGAGNATIMYWYVMDNITVDAVKWFHGADTATGDSTAAHLMSYAIDTGNGSASGDLSDGTVVFDSGTITNAGYEQIYYDAMTERSPDVDAGRVIIFTFTSDTVNSDYSIMATVKFHIR